ncbi:Fic family protein, partial [Pseudoalteromonas sp. SG41-5]|nr:Fic family protein [Pseudoalteromonas sp. SG41-5]
INHQTAIPKNIQPLLTCIKQAPSLSTKVFAKKLDLGTATVERHIKWLKDHKVIKRIGSKKDGYWQVLNNEK